VSDLISCQSIHLNVFAGDSYHDDEDEDVDIENGDVEEEHVVDDDDDDEDDEIKIIPMIPSHVRSLRPKKATKRFTYSSKKKTRSCIHCGKSYNRVQSFWRHMRECGAEPKYECTLCAFKCLRKFSLDRHVKRH